MKKALLCGLVLVLAAACGGVRKTQEAVNTGNYQQAIHRAIDNLADNKTKKGNQAYVLLLEEAYAKYTERELQEIAFLKQDGNPANLETIYEKYNHLKEVQNRIRPLLPLPIFEENRDARFRFENYDREILATKDDLSEYLYTNASQLLAGAQTKYDYRQAYDDFRYLEEINPGYGDTRDLMEQARIKGLDYVKVTMINDTQQIVPARLEEELLNFNTYGLDDLWTTYHTNPVDEVEYDYEMQVAFRDIVISPERVNEKQFIQERQIPDGKQFLLDEEGNVVKDSLGNKIEVDRFRSVRCNFYQFTQQKTAHVNGNVNFIDLHTRQSLNSYPLASQFVFEHVYANYDGDRRALDNDLVALLDLAAVPFPSDEQMVYDAGEDLKARLKNILQRQKFNR
ncbi:MULTISPECIES: hypothetical protein [Robiginitalea]|uniref:Lipoprotein n=1 Tax=Robiginitalea biformata (strain ATCC BAA-864 / DSM 15991 / KCTC 12146 / HTCC2501) TaxID=313596 RepID=A4CLS5_ROBBH|nr:MULTISPECIES: hypothetical protein [Robiginitalea]EAR15824.1 hypothetical protein RB2501_15889 [Robiginitalea biformata HTCC2501]MDC6354248.1 hypothetical protein [Robiginitalea sp. PM2]MDC6374515.1 hypothetical protein [Robiginitalea sp. SP8]